MRTLLRASSLMSHELNFHTCAAMLYSSIRGSCNIHMPQSNIQMAVKGKKTELTRIVVVLWCEGMCPPGSDIITTSLGFAWDFPGMFWLVQKGTDSY